MKDNNVVHPWEYEKRHSEPVKLEPIKRVCPKCKDKAEYYIPPGHDGSRSYYRCVNKDCMHVGPNYTFPPSHKGSPLGYTDPYHLSKGGNFAVIEKRRNVSTGRHSGDTFGLRRNLNREQDQIPLLAGKEDIELKAMLERGVLLSLVDDPGVDDGNNIDDNYSD